MLSTGFEMAARLPVGEVRDPQRHLPRALTIALLVVATLYILIQVVCVGTLCLSFGPVNKTTGRRWFPLSWHRRRLVDFCRSHHFYHWQLEYSGSGRIADSICNGRAKGTARIHRQITQSIRNSYTSILVTSAIIACS